MTKKKINIHQVCNDCGLEASNGKICTDTFHMSICEVSGEEKAVIESRDYGSKLIKKRTDKQTLKIIKEKINTRDFDSSSITGADLILGFEREEKSLKEFRKNFDNLKKAIVFFSLSKFPTNIDPEDPNISVILDIQRELYDSESVLVEELFKPLINNSYDN